MLWSVNVPAVTWEQQNSNFTTFYIRPLNQILKNRITETGVKGRRVGVSESSSCAELTNTERNKTESHLVSWNVSDPFHAWIVFSEEMLRASFSWPCESLTLFMWVFCFTGLIFSSVTSSWTSSDSLFVTCNLLWGQFSLTFLRFTRGKQYERNDSWRIFWLIPWLIY